MENHYIIQSISSTPEWKKIFTIILNHCDQFEVFFPDGPFDEENPLMAGKLDFEKLEDTSFIPCDGMNDSVCGSGNLTRHSIKLIYELEEPSFIGDKPELWHFKLSKNKILYLTIADFTVCLLENHKDIISILEEHGIDSSIFE